MALSVTIKDEVFNGVEGEHNLLNILDAFQELYDETRIPITIGLKDVHFTDMTFDERFEKNQARKVMLELMYGFHNRTPWRRVIDWAKGNKIATNLWTK